MYFCVVTKRVQLLGCLEIRVKLVQLLGAKTLRLAQLHGLAQEKLQYEAR